MYTSNINTILTSIINAIKEATDRYVYFGQILTQFFTNKTYDQAAIFFDTKLNIVYNLYNQYVL